MNREYLFQMRQEFAASLMFEEVPEHEMVRREVEAIFNVTLGRGHGGRYAVPQFGARWWKAVWKIMRLEFKRAILEQHPEKVRHVPRDPKRHMAIIKGVTN